jgi:hypothetical protein
MNTQEMFDRISQWEAAEMTKNPFVGTNKGVNWGRSVKQKFAAMRRNVMATAFNAEQFNRRAEWCRKTGRSQEQAKAMFPTRAEV